MLIMDPIMLWLIDDEDEFECTKSNMVLTALLVSQALHWSYSSCMRYKCQVHSIIGRF